MKLRTLEITVGLFMVFACVSFLFLALKVSGLSLQSLAGENGYDVKAVFSNIGNLKPRSVVRVAGVAIGHVQKIELDRETYEAKVTLFIKGNINNLPSDSSASIVSNGLLGDNYVSLQPGYNEDFLKSDSTIETTYPATSIESLISTFVGGQKNGK